MICHNLLQNCEVLLVLKSEYASLNSLVKPDMSFSVLVNFLLFFGLKTIKNSSRQMLQLYAYVAYC